MILQNFREDKTLTRESLCAKTGLSDATVKREVAYLKRIGVLK
ncbi:MAG: HTH domain-containing protein [Paraprevotella sp.]|nr:HTH domain-containing protein [Paraprevotella sp.]